MVEQSGTQNVIPMRRRGGVQENNQGLPEPEGRFSAIIADVIERFGDVELTRQDGSTVRVSAVIVDVVATLEMQKVKALGVDREQPVPDVNKITEQLVAQLGEAANDTKVRNMLCELSAAIVMAYNNSQISPNGGTFSSQSVGPEGDEGGHMMGAIFTTMPGTTASGLISTKKGGSLLHESEHYVMCQHDDGYLEQQAKLTLYHEVGHAYSGGLAGGPYGAVGETGMIGRDAGYDRYLAECYSDAFAMIAMMRDAKTPEEAAKVIEMAEQLLDWRTITYHDFIENGAIAYISDVNYDVMDTIKGMIAHLKTVLETEGGLESIQSMSVDDMAKETTRIVRETTLDIGAFDLKLKRLADPKYAQHICNLAHQEIPVAKPGEELTPEQEEQKAQIEAAKVELREIIQTQSDLDIAEAEARGRQDERFPPVEGDPIKAFETELRHVLSGLNSYEDQVAFLEAERLKLVLMRQECQDKIASGDLTRAEEDQVLMNLGEYVAPDDETAAEVPKGHVSIQAREKIILQYIRMAREAQRDAQKDRDLSDRASALVNRDEGRDVA